jgi:hypothetical protein
MKSPTPKDHIACQSIHRFVIEALGVRTKRTCTCLAEARDMICQRYPDLAPQIVAFYAQAIEFRQALLASLRKCESPQEGVRWFDAEENPRPDRSEYSPTLGPATAAVEEDDATLASAVQHLDLLSVDNIQSGGDSDSAPCLETSSGTYIPFSNDFKAINDENPKIRFQGTTISSGARTCRTVPPQITLYTNLHSQGGADQEFGRELEPQRADTYYRKTLVQAIEHSLDTQDSRSPTIDFELSFQEVQTPQQQTTLPVELAGSVVDREKGRKRGLHDNEKWGAQKEKQGQELENLAESYTRKDQENDKERAKDEMDGEEAGNNDEDEDETVRGSPDPVREKELIESATRARADSIGLGGSSSNHQSNKRPLEDTVPKGPPSKRSKAATHVDNEFRTPDTTTTSTGTPDQSFWDEWDMKRAAMTNHGQETDQSVKAVRVWRRLSTKHSPGLSRSPGGQDTSLGNVDKLVTMVLAVANCYAFGALKEVIGLLQQDRAAGTSEIFSNDPKVLMETVSTIEKAGHLNSYIRRFTLARLANIYMRTAANGGRLTLDDDGAYPLPRGVVTKVQKAATFSAMILHIWGVPFPARYKGAKMTRRGLIDSSSADASQWNKCKGRLCHQIDSGRRWLALAIRFGWSTLGLITQDWSIGDSKVVASDGM